MSKQAKIGHKPKKNNSTTVTIGSVASGLLAVSLIGSFFGLMVAEFVGM